MENSTSTKSKKNKQYTIFLTDDDAEDRNFFSEALEETWHNVHLVLFQSAEALLEDLGSDNPLPDFIFLDLYMPIMDGEQCLSIIRDNPAWDPICIIIYSNYVDLGKISELFHCGANRYLKKPSSYISLQKVLERVIESLKNNPTGGQTIFNYSE